MVGSCPLCPRPRYPVECRSCVRSSFRHALVGLGVDYLCRNEPVNTVLKTWGVSQSGAKPGRAISLRRFADGDSRREKNRQKWRILPQPQSLGGNAERAELDNDGARLRKRAMFKSHRAFLSHQRRRRPQQSRINRRWTTWPAPTFHYVREVAVMGGRKPSPCCAPEREA